jgi:hypothetical protein
MRASIIAFVGLLGLAAASPAKRDSCLDQDAAQQVAENFRTLITNYSDEAAARVLSPDFLDYSDSVNELINNGCPNGPAPLGSPTFSSLQEFQDGQGSQPNIPFEILNVWQGCNFVTMRWVSSAPGTVQPEQQVTGIVVMEVCQGGGDEPWIIDTVYSEFNSGAWLYDLGVFVPQCSGSASNVKVRRTLSGLPVMML